MKKEIWKDIGGFEKLYQVSDFGRVKSLPRRVRNRNGHALTKGRILTPGIDKKRLRLYVNLYNKNKPTTRLIHQLVLRAFVGPCPEGKEVAHWDGNPSNNRLGNLLYCTHAENISHKKIHGTEPQGEKHYGAILTERVVREIRKNYIARCPINGAAAFARKLGVSQVTISDVVSGKNWKHVQ